MPKWEKTGAAFLINLPSLSRIDFARRQLSDSCFVEFVRSPSGPDCPSLLGAALSCL